jgi:hypothetical protein
VSLLDRLIEEIASITGLTTEEVIERYTQEQLDAFLESSICEPIDSVVPYFSDPNDTPCAENTSSDIVNNLKDLGKFPEGLDDIANNFPKADEPEKQFDGTECVDSVEEVNKIIDVMIRTYNDHDILVNRLYELQDNLIPLNFYYEERAKRLAYILNDFRSTIEDIKRLESEKDKIDEDNKILKDKRNSLIVNLSILTNKTEYEAYQSLIDINNSKLDKIKKEISDLKNVLKNKTQKYPTLSSINNNINLNTTSTIDSSEVIALKLRLSAYSEYIKIEEQRSYDKISDRLTKSRIHFTLNFQNLNSVRVTRENVNKETGERTTYEEDFPIKNSPLLKKNSFFTGVSGYTIKDIVAKDNSSGSLYQQYYNKFNDPINEFFTLDERGLTDNSNLVDPKLKGGQSERKKEGDKEYYIKDLDTLQNFYKEFDSIFKNRTRQVREKVTNADVDDLKKLLVDLARQDIDLIVSLSTVNLNLPEDDNTLRTLIDKISIANQKFSAILVDLNSEISRIEGIMEENKLSPSKIKNLLKKSNSKCFDKIPEEDDEGCPDVHAKRGSDPFFKTMVDGIDPNLPNFSQLCYWKEFAKLATMQGLFPMPQDARTMRYWPVGLVIPTPAKLIKIPLPMIWLPLITISSAAGTLVFFLNINGLFISPIVFVMTASGLKLHMMTLRGSSEKFGFDTDDDTIKPYLKIPLAVAAAKDMIKFGGSIDINKYATEEEKVRLEAARKKKKEADSEGNRVKSKKAEREISRINESVNDRVKPKSQKMKEAADNIDNIEDTIKEIKDSIFKIMDDLGNVSLNSINKLKERAYARREELIKQKTAALERGDTEEVARINKELKIDGINIKDKIDAISKDILSFYDTIHFPRIVIPKDSDKLNMKTGGNFDVNFKMLEMTSNFNIDLQSIHFSKIKTNIGVNIAERGVDLERNANFKVLNVEENSEEVKEKMKDMLNGVKEFILENKELLSLTPFLVNSLSSLKISFDPFAPCCNKKPVSITPAIPPETLLIIGAATQVVVSAIDGMSSDNFKSIFGGKLNITPRDLRFGLNSICQNVIPDSIALPKLGLDIKSSLNMFGGLINSISIPQVKLPGSISSFLLSKKIVIDTNILKDVIGNQLKDHCSKNLISSIPQDLEKDFINLNSQDLKIFIKDLIESCDTDITDKIQPFYDSM